MERSDAGCLRGWIEASEVLSLDDGDEVSSKETQLKSLKFCNWNNKLHLPPEK